MKAGTAGDFLCLGLLVALCLAAGLPRYRSSLDLGDEGLLTYGAIRVMEGQVPNRDFVSLQPPLSFYVSAAMFKVFGTSLWSLRVLGLAIYVTIPLLIYGVTRCLTCHGLALAAALPSTVLGISFAHFVPVAVWQAVTTTLGAVLLYLLATTSAGRRRFLALPAGVLTAAAMFLRQDEGFYLVIAILAYTTALRFVKSDSGPKPGLKTPFGFWVLGMLMVLLPFGIYWVVTGAMGPMFRQLVIFPLTTYAKTSSLPFPSFRSALTFGPGVVGLLYYAPPVMVLLAGVWLGRRILRGSFSDLEAKLILVLVWSALFYCQVLVRSDMDHLLITLPPFFILLASCLAKFLTALSRVSGGRHATELVSKSAACVFAGLIAAGFLLRVKPDFLPEPIGQAETLELARGGVRKLGANNLKKFIERIQLSAPPDRPILCLPYQPMFYFLCERRNPTRWNYLWPGDQTREDHLALIQEAKSDPPSVVVITGEPEMARYAPEILEYVHTDYQLAANAGGMFLVYLPVMRR